VEDFLQGLLQRMGLEAQIESAVDLEEGDEPAYRFNITGGDLGILIGRRAETLDAIQYLARLVVNQRTHRWHRIEVDVENYRRRREQSLQRLARNMADRAVSEGRTIVLEPMPPRERRIVHLALRDREDVRTESIGEGEGRKVTIIPQ
jgi:spoIIIJ-associated protein